MTGDPCLRPVLRQPYEFCRKEERVLRNLTEACSTAGLALVLQALVTGMASEWQLTGTIDAWCTVHNVYTAGGVLMELDASCTAGITRLPCPLTCLVPCSPGGPGCG
jgi:hypothetical protein